MAGDESSPVYLHHVERLSRSSRTIEPEQYLQTDPNQIIVDYMASMTDSYFMALYEYLFPYDQLAIFARDYCSDLGMKHPNAVSYCPQDSIEG